MPYVQGTDMKDVPYITLSLMTDLASLGDDGMYHCPMAIESWPPGLDVAKMLQLALNSLQEDIHDEHEV